MEPRRPRRLTMSHAVSTGVRTTLVVALAALTAAPESTLVWKWSSPQWMMQLPRGRPGPTLVHKSVVHATDEIRTVPSFVFPTDIGVPARLGAGIQSVHAVQRTADLEPDLYARAWQRAIDGSPAFATPVFEYTFPAWGGWFDHEDR